MTNYMEEAFAPAVARDRDRVLSATFGHLGPELGRTYHGTVTFACANYGGDIAFLSIDFKLGDGTSLLDNPWSFEDITDHIVQWVCDQANGYRNRRPIEQPVETDGKVFTFTGSYTRFKNDNCRIAGTFRERSIS